VLMGEPLPRNAAGKFLKRELREQIVNGTLKADRR
jgi:acyl-CoA synthetase (AMP-forming)/AMP-acid ligase II